MRTPEGEEKDILDKFFAGIECWYFKPFMRGYGKNGVSDIIACIPLTITTEMVGHKIGVFVAMEVKREGKEPTVIQERRINEVQAAHGRACAGTAAIIIAHLRRWFSL